MAARNITVLGYLDLIRRGGDIERAAMAQVKQRIKQMARVSKVETGVTVATTVLAAIPGVNVLGLIAGAGFAIYKAVMARKAKKKAKHAARRVAEAARLLSPSRSWAVATGKQLELAPVRWNPGSSRMGGLETDPSLRDVGEIRSGIFYHRERTTALKRRKSQLRVERKQAAAQALTLARATGFAL